MEHVDGRPLNGRELMAFQRLKDQFTGDTAPTDGWDTTPRMPDPGIAPETHPCGGRIARGGSAIVGNEAEIRPVTE
jgi:hypothetical protein